MTDMPQPILPLLAALEALDAWQEAPTLKHRSAVGDALARVISDRVRELASAQYAALGIVGPVGGIERFITSGVTPEQRTQIGGGPPEARHRRQSSHPSIPGTIARTQSGLAGWDAW